MRKIVKRKIAAACVAAFMVLQCLPGAAAYADGPSQEVVLEKTAHWTDERAYEAEIDLTVKGMQSYTEKQKPVNIVPVLDVTASMNYCDTPGHTKLVIGHTLSTMENSKEIWEEIKETLPDEETYRKLGEESPDQLFLSLPESVDPEGKCRLVCGQEDRSDRLPYDNISGWKIIYVTDDQTLLTGVEEGTKLRRFSHTIDHGGIYLPVGETKIFENRTTWHYYSGKTERWQCEKSRMEHLEEGYAQFLDAVFEDMQPMICPIVFIGGYYINGWTQSKEEARDFLTEKEYLNKEAVLPAQNNGTNHEAAVLGALDAVEELENKENTFVILFTDGTTTAGYSHADGSADLGLLDSHSYGMAEEDSSWYSQFSQWALEDATVLKEQVPIYGIGYGSDMGNDTDSQEFIEALSSGEEYYIDTRQEEMQDIGSIFKAVYSDLCWKAVKVQVTDYVSEYWKVKEGELPMGSKVESVGIVNQRGEEDTITRITFPVTKEMGEDDQENFRIPVVLREAYREVQEPTLYETNQDEPLSKDVDGTGAYVTYEDENQVTQKVMASSPELKVCPNKIDYTVQKEALQKQVKAGQDVLYKVTLTNTGGWDLENVSLTDVYPEQEISVRFLGQEGVEVGEDGARAVVKLLPRGETVVLEVRAQIPETAKGTLTNKLTAMAVNPESPEETLVREAEASVEVEPAVLDYTVKKTADKTHASAGDTIHYEITITNTGEQTLRSVVTTDKFTVEGVQAVFEEQEGVSLNEEKNQAYVEAVAPGEELVLRAEVTLPEDFKDSTLVNMAVVSVEGSQPKESQAEVKISEKPIPTTTPKVEKQNSGTGTTASGEKKASPVKTQDDSRAELFAVLAMGSAVALAGIFLRVKNRKVEK